MTKEEYQKKINELKEQKNASNAQIEQVKNEFRDSLLMEYYSKYIIEWNNSN